jgi:hypothetical protein
VYTHQDIERLGDKFFKVYAPCAGDAFHPPDENVRFLKICRRGCIILQSFDNSESCEYIYIYIYIYYILTCSSLVSCHLSSLACSVRCQWRTENRYADRCRHEGVVVHGMRPCVRMFKRYDDRVR